MHWRMRTKNGRPLWENGRFSIAWMPERASWTAYDSQEKKHYHGIQNLGNAMDLSTKISDCRITIGLVACCKGKLPSRTIAERLYCSDLFMKAADYCRRHYQRWFILSALHGLVVPSQLLDPYDYTLVGKSVNVRRTWAEKVLAQLRSRDLLNKSTEFFFHAGQEYSEFLVPAVPNAHCPLRGLGIGQQLSFYKKEELNAARIPEKI